MAITTDLPTEERLVQLFQHLGIRQAHIAGVSPEDWAGLATTHPERCASLTLVGPPAVDPQAVGRLATRLLVVNGDQGARAERVRRDVERIAGAQVVTLHDYAILGWTDVVADRTEEIGSAMLRFLARRPPSTPGETVPPTEGDGEMAGIAYRIRGTGPPLVLLPLALFPSQWDPLVSRLSEQYCTITLGGAALGMVAMLESRGSAAGYWAMVRTLLAEVHLRPGESLVEVGCGSGVVTRGLAHSTRGAHRIVGVDINRYLLREATALAEKEGLADTIAFQEGHAHALSFPDQSVDVTLAVTVMEEVDADPMLGEMVRVTKPGGWVAALVRACDRPFLMNLPLQPALHRKVEDPSGWAPGAETRGCADASLLRRFQ
jgi:SAM-dependent methyltransferase